MTIYVDTRPYQAVDLNQTLAITRSVQYGLSAKVGPDVPEFSGYQLFSANYATPVLVFNQKNSQGTDFHFCPTTTFPLFGETLVSLTASLDCVGSANLSYDVNLSPEVGYARINPNVSVKLKGALTLNATIVVGTAETDFTLASFSSAASTVAAACRVVS